VAFSNSLAKIRKERIIKPQKNTHGYLSVGLSFNGFLKNFCIHQLVAVAFLNHKMDGTYKIVVDHINNIKTDNRVGNLQLITSRENSSKEKRGTSQYTGVSWNKKIQKWNSFISINRKNKNSS